MKPSNLLMLWFTVGVIIMVVGGSIVFLPGLNLTAGPYFFYRNYMHPYLFFPIFNMELF